MSESQLSATTAPVASDSPGWIGKYAGYLAVALAVGLLWVPIVNHLRIDWSISTYYDYGWLIPILSLILLRYNLHELPVPAIPANPLPGILLYCLAVLGLALTFPILEANPDWRPLAWFLTFCGCVGSVAISWLKGGMPYVKRFAFVCFFPLLAVPWPRPLEVELIKYLSELNAIIAVEVLHWLVIEAERVGMVIFLADGPVAIDDACSGIRSFQSLLVTGFFIGEYLRFPLALRVITILVCLSLSMLINLLRIVSLAVFSGTSGLDVIDQWHDTAGFMAIIILSLTTIIIADKLMDFRKSDSETAKAPSPNKKCSNRSFFLLALLTAALFSVSAVATEAWFASAEKEKTKQPDWGVNFPTRMRAFTMVPMSEQAKADLRYNYATQASWQNPDGLKCNMFYIEWEPGRNSPQLARNHNPAICLRGTHFKLESRLDPVTFTLNGLELRFNSYLFRNQGIPVYIFDCVTDNFKITGRSNKIGDNSLSGRLGNVKNKKRHLGQQRLGISIHNAESASDAYSHLRKILQDAIQVHDSQ